MQKKMSGYFKGLPAEVSAFQQRRPPGGRGLSPGHVRHSQLALSGQGEGDRATYRRHGRPIVKHACDVREGFNGSRRVPRIKLRIPLIDSGTSLLFRHL